MGTDSLWADSEKVPRSAAMERTSNRIHSHPWVCVVYMSCLRLVYIGATGGPLYDGARSSDA